MMANNTNGISTDITINNKKLETVRSFNGMKWNIILRKAEDREEWRKLVVKSTVVPQRSAKLRDR